MKNSAFYIVSTVAWLLGHHVIAVSAARATSLMSSLEDHGDNAQRNISPCSLRLKPVATVLGNSKSPLASRSLNGWKSTLSAVQRRTSTRTSIPFTPLQWKSLVLNHTSKKFSSIDPAANKFVARKTRFVNRLSRAISPISKMGSDMSCHDKASHDDGSSVSVFLFESASLNQRQQSPDENANRKSSAQLMNESQMQRLVEGARVAIYWPGYNRYYEAEVLEIGTATTFYVEYMDDQITEWIDAGRDTFRVISGPSSPSLDDNDHVSWTQVNMRDLLRSANIAEAVIKSSTDAVIKV